jgi:citrate lyase beta subunit
MRARRALLYMPGDDPHKIQKATRLGVDCVCMDMEDGVAINRKSEARRIIAQSLQELEFGRSERLVRINAVGSGLEQEDLQAVLSYKPDGIVVPKVETAAQVRWVSEQIANAGYALAEMGLIAIVESALGVVKLAEIAGQGERLQAIIFGAEDLAGDIGATRTRQGWEVFYARSAVVTYAAAFGLQAIDQVYVDFKDTAGLKIEARVGAQMGFAGKQIIHPNQVGPVQEAFTPSDSEIEHALQILSAASHQQEAGFGAFALDGKMVDAPIVKAAERVLERAHAAGKLTS